MRSSAARLLGRADKILADVDASYIISHRGHKQRLMPVFRPEEITLGKTLGTGGFGIVQEIDKITLDPEEDAERLEKAQEYNNNQLTNGNSHGNINNNNNNNNNNASDNHSGRVSTVISTCEELLLQDDHVHYNVDMARHWMSQRCQRQDVARYALKRLHGDLNEVERARGMIDLAVEAKYLSVVWHPNISK